MNLFIHRLVNPKTTYLLMYLQFVAMATVLYSQRINDMETRISIIFKISQGVSQITLCRYGKDNLL